MRRSRSRVVAYRIAGPMSQHVLAMLARTDGPRLNLMVASDNNIAALTSLLGVHFHIDGYGYDDPPPGGAFGLEVLRDRITGERYVRAFYQAQTLEQLRQLTPLSRTQPPDMQWLVIDGCKMQGSEACRLSDFRALLHRRSTLPLRPAG